MAAATPSQSSSRANGGPRARTFVRTRPHGFTLGQMNPAKLLLLFAMLGAAAFAQTSDYRLALPDHSGLLKWSVDGFKIVENSAKPNGHESGVRGASAQVRFLGFLFLAPESAPMTSTTCRDAAMTQERKTNVTLKITKTSDIPRTEGFPVALTTYTTANRDGSLSYAVRGFVATGDTCGDLAFYSGKPITEDSEDLKRAFQSLQLDPHYEPQFADLATYAQVLFQTHQYQAAAPLFEKAFSTVPGDGAPFKSATIARRIMRDQAGMSYGIAGDFAKARRIFEKGTADDPDYPMNYYNLACADAGEKKLSDARVHLQQAFDRKGNMNAGETMPVPTQDDSFLPYKDNKDFWAFLQRLQGTK